MNKKLICLFVVLSINTILGMSSSDEEDSNYSSEEFYYLQQEAIRYVNSRKTKRLKTKAAKATERANKLKPDSPEHQRLKERANKLIEQKNQYR